MPGGPVDGPPCFLPSFPRPGPHPARCVLTPVELWPWFELPVTARDHPQQYMPAPAQSLSIAAAETTAARFAALPPPAPDLIPPPPANSRAVLFTVDSRPQPAGAQSRDNHFPGFGLIPPAKVHLNLWSNFGGHLILRRNTSNPNAAGVILSNRNSGKKLHARVELDPTNHALNIAISRPK